MFSDSPPAARDLRAELIAAATAMLADPQQVAVPSLRSIARACHVAPSAVYWHFPSEAELRTAVLNAHYTDLVSAVDRAADGVADARQALRAAGLAFVDWGLTHRGAYQLLFESADHLGVERAPHGATVQQRIVGLMAAVEDSSPFADALMLTSALHGVVSLRMHKPDLGWSTTAHQDAETLVRALVGARATTSRAAR